MRCPICIFSLMFNQLFTIMTEKEKQNHLVAKAWVFFCFNFNSPYYIIRHICKQTGREDLIDHLTDKFEEIYERVGSRAAMNVFYCEINCELRDALVDFAVKEYAPSGLLLSNDEKELLGI